jgi:hypothetical protein
MRWTSIALGAMSLGILDAVVSSSAAASNVGGVLSGAGKAVEWFISPTVPAFGASSAAKTKATTGAATAPAPVQLAGADAGAATSAPALWYSGPSSIPGEAV